jgi:hypothetical protein
MQPTELQVQRSLQALTEGSPDGPAAIPGAGEPVVDAPETDWLDGLPPGLVDRLRDLSEVRHDRLASARRRLATGDQPSAEALAQRMVGRLVCDRLR